jgi:hypothetical protein
MTRRRTLARLLVLGSLIAGALVATSPPAAAAFHLMKIREVGLDGPAGIDFVELQMYSAGQNFVGGHKLVLYDSTGTPFEYSIPNDVGNGANQATILFGSTGFTNPPPDFTVPSTAMTSSGGGVCFESSTSQIIDCVEWGASGVAPVSADPPASAPADGQSLERTIAPGCPTLLEDADDTGASATDFVVQPMPNPEPNSATPNETPCAPGTPGGKPVLQGLKTRVKGNRAIISGQIQPPAPGQQVKLTFFANGSPLRKIAKKSATLNADSKFKKKFRVPTDSTRCKVKVAFQGQAMGQKKFKC